MKRTPPLWVQYLFLAYLALMGVYEVVRGAWLIAVLALIGAGGFVVLILVTRAVARSERPGAADGRSVILFRAMPGVRGAPERVTAARLTPPVRVLVPAPPSRLVDPAAPEFDWQTPMIVLARRGESMLTFPDSSGAMRWTLGMIRYEGLQERLFVMVPRRPGAFTRATLAVSRAQLAPWPGFEAILREAGLRPPDAQPAPGTLLGFDEHGAAVTVATGLTSMNALNPALVAVLDHTARRNAR